ncbi:MAG: alternative ribosome rescue aminoacyl-tRNA hydrolase ArfB [Gaiellales bacterium]
MSDRLSLTSRTSIPLDDIVVRVSRSSGPGGQHANTAETRVEVSFDVAASSLRETQKRRVTDRLGPIVRAVAQDSRSQVRNRELALERLAAKLREGLRVERTRVPSRPTAASVERRLEGKRRRAAVKRSRAAREDES